MNSQQTHLDSVGFQFKNRQMIKLKILLFFRSENLSQNDVLFVTSKTPPHTTSLGLREQMLTAKHIGTGDVIGMSNDPFFRFEGDVFDNKRGHDIVTAIYIYFVILNFFFRFCNVSKYNQASKSSKINC